MMVQLATTVAIALVTGGLAFTVVAVVGLLRLPDLYSRAHAASKSETLGALLSLGGAAVVFGSGQPVLKLAVLSVFVLVTSPTAAHAIVRSGHEQGIEPWTRGDEE